jgi:hypothetical protein
MAFITPARAKGKSSELPAMPAETLSGARTLTASEVNRWNLFSFDPGGAARTLTLPTAAGLKNKVLVIANTGNATEPITVVDGDSNAVVIIDQGQRALIWSDGTTVFGGAIGSTSGIVKFSQTVAFDDFTDGGAAVGTYVITAGTIPVGAYFLCTLLTSVTGFAGDTSAVLTVGDGTDVDRYNTGTPDIFSTVANGVALGDPSGVRYHAAAGTITLTVTTNADFTSVSDGSLDLEFYFLT